MTMVITSTVARATEKLTGDTWWSYPGSRPWEGFGLQVSRTGRVDQRRRPPQVFGLVSVPEAVLGG
jgi:hypothetical protein